MQRDQSSIVRSHRSVRPIQSIEDTIQTTADRLTEARRSRLHIIAPKPFSEAVSELASTRERFERGGKIEDIQSRLTSVNAKLDRCDTLQKIGELLLRDSFAARTDAIAANAPEFAAELWKDAEKSIRDAGRRIEDGRQNDARQDAAKAGTLYRDAELQAIRVDILGSARAERERALSCKAAELAVSTFGAAGRDLHRSIETVVGVGVRSSWTTEDVFRRS